MYPMQPPGPKITLLPGPKMRSSRRGLLALLGLMVLGGAGAGAWILRPEGAVDWSKRVTPFRYGPSASRVGSLFVPTVAAETPCPLLLLLDPGQAGARICTRYARRCEQFGWVAVSCDSLGGSASPDMGEVNDLLDYVRANANVSAARVVVAGFDVAADAACRLALVDPDTFSGAIMECGSLRAWRDVGALARADQRFFLFSREQDGSREAMATMRDEMARKGLRVESSEVSGGHAPMEREELDPAFAWLESLRG
jgi:predicted esterase